MLKPALLLACSCLLVLRPRVQLVPAWTPAVPPPAGALIADGHAGARGASARRPARPGGEREERSCAAFDWGGVIDADLADAAVGPRTNTSTRAIVAAVDAQRARGAALIALSARGGRLYVHHRTAPWCGRWQRCWFRARVLLDGLQAALTAPSDTGELPPDVDLVLCLADDCGDAAAALPVPPLVFSRTIVAALEGAEGGTPESHGAPRAAAPSPLGRAAAARADGGLGAGARPPAALRVPYDYVRVAARGCAAGGVRERARRLALAPFRALAALAETLARAGGCAARAAGAPPADGGDGAPWCGGGQALPWEARAHVAVFRGGWANEQREQLCGLAARAPHALDVALSGSAGGAAPSGSGCRLGPFESLEAQAGRARMLIDVAGVTWSDRLPRALASGATLLIVANPHGSADYLSPYLRPWVHFVPVAADMSDLLGAVRWCGEHAAECAAIAARGADLASRYASAAAVRCHLQQLVAAYAERVQRARVADDCGPAPERGCGLHPLQPAPPRGAAPEPSLSLVLDSAALRVGPVGLRVWRRELSGRLAAAALAYAALAAAVLRTASRHSQAWRARAAERARPLFVWHSQPAARLARALGLRPSAAALLPRFLPAADRKCPSGSSD